MGTALTIKSNDPCDPDHMFEVSKFDVDCRMSAPCPVSGQSRKCRSRGVQKGPKSTSGSSHAALQVNRTNLSLCHLCQITR